MSGDAALSGVSSRFSPAPPLSPVPLPHVRWPGPVCAQCLWEGVPGGFLALDFQRPRQAGRIPIYEGSPIQKQRQGSGVGVTGVSPGLSPKRLELQEAKGSSRDPGKAACSQPLGVAGQQPQDPGHRLQEGDSHGTIWGITDGNQPAPDPGPGSHSCPQSLGLTKTGNPGDAGKSQRRNENQPPDEVAHQPGRMTAQNGN